MHYNFDEIIDRTGSQSAKYDERLNKFGRADVIPLWVADMDFRTAQPIIDALQAKAAHGIFGYTSRPDSYFQAVCDWQRQRNGWSFDTALAAHCLGVVPAISAIVSLFTAQTDKILIQPPVYPEFEDAVHTWGRQLLINPLLEKDGHFSVDFDHFEQCLKQKPKLFILCSPHNPGGRVWTRDELTRMNRLCLDYGVRVVSDEIHSDLVLWGNRHIPTASLSPEISANTITCLSGTKTFNLAGLHACTVVFPDEESHITFQNFWKNLDISRNNSFSVVAMEAAFRHGGEWLEQLLRYLEGNMEYVHDFCAQNIPEIKARIPESTYLIWLDCRSLAMEDDALFRFMVDKAGLGMNSGASFGQGGQGHMRLNAACPRSVLEQAMAQLKAAVDSWRV